MPLQMKNVDRTNDSLGDEVKVRSTLLLVRLGTELSCDQIKRDTLPDLRLTLSACGFQSQATRSRGTETVGSALPKTKL
jgi:hypothetical protein